MTGTPLTKANSLPGNLLRRCHQISVAIFLRQCEAYNLTQLQYVVLAALDERGPLDQITLGGCTALDRNTVAVVVRKLEERGLVTRQRNPEDRRSMVVTLTEAGEALRMEAEAAVLKAQDDILGPLNEEERELLCGLLQRMADENNALSRVPIRSAG
ncbi:MarR family winged helix-turn-helix transcriptional regulator [Billgrantia bachuensis]|uniref:MarR family transcriptional regulator n=1 Tax=Billgrantia bachuensis TaxID=2717286 RepID=A0ABX0PUR9_9GAMM|nr:MarR family transcriptional regulator [Halomonas bachuensis]NIC07177.1 MarR family transcriptional regulator [Halomonas bachuensis]